MLKSKNGIQGLGGAQQEYLIYLAENGAHNSNSLAESLGGKDQGNVYRALKKLEKLCLITPVSEKEYRGRVFDEYWLTPEGARASTIYDVDIDTMKNRAKDYYQGEELTKFNAQADMIMFGKEALTVYESFMKMRVTLSDEEMRAASAKVFEAFPKYLEKYPHIDKKFNESLMGKLFKRLVLEIGKVFKKG